MFGFAFWKVVGQRSGQQVASWKVLGPSWMHSLGALGAVLEAFWAVLEALGDSLGTLGAV